MYVPLTSHKHFSKCAGAIYKYNFVIVYSTGGPGYKCGFYLLYISMVTWLLIQFVPEWSTIPSPSFPYFKALVTHEFGVVSSESSSGFGWLQPIVWVAKAY